MGYAAASTLNLQGTCNEEFLLLLTAKFQEFGTLPTWNYEVWQSVKEKQSQSHRARLSCKPGREALTLLSQTPEESHQPVAGTEDKPKVKVMCTKSIAE